jgi:hypothetical protein
MTIPGGVTAGDGEGDLTVVEECLRVRIDILPVATTCTRLAGIEPALLLILPDRLGQFQHAPANRMPYCKSYNIPDKASILYLILMSTRIPAGFL